MTSRKGPVEKLEGGKDALVQRAEIKVYQPTKGKVTAILSPLT